MTLKITQERVNQLLRAKREQDQAIAAGKVVPPSERFPHDKLTEVQSLYLHSGDGQPFIVESRYTRVLESIGGKLLTHYGTATEEWQALIDPACNWPALGKLVVCNSQGVYPLVKPSEEEKRLEEARILELRVGDTGEPALVIFVREDARFMPFDWKNLRVRCQKGTANYIALGVPK